MGGVAGERQFRLSEFFYFFDEALFGGFRLTLSW